MNTSSYPRIHYPEVYILKGGYCHYFKSSAINCDPRAYVPMNHPEFARDRREDFDQFRKAPLGRTRELCVRRLQDNGAFAAVLWPVPSQFRAECGQWGEFAVRRRECCSDSPCCLDWRFSLSTLVEDANTTLVSSDDGTEESNGVDCSPCPPQSARMFASNAMSLQC